MADARGSQTQIEYIVEVTYGTTPGSPTMILMRNKGTTLDMTKGSNISLELRGDRNIHDFRHGVRLPKGAINTELSYADLDFAMEALLCGTWTSQASGTPNTLINGVTNRSFTMEVGHLDIAQYRPFKGCRFTKGTFGFKPSGTICTADFEIEAQDLGTLSGTSLSGSPTASSTNTVMDSFSGVLNEGGSSIAYVTGIDIVVDNKPNDAIVIGSKIRRDVVFGYCTVTGTMTALFEDAVVINKFLNETSTSLDITVNGSPANKTLKFKLPAIKYTGGSVPVQNDGLLVLNMPFQAIFDSGTAATIQLTRSNP